MLRETRESKGISLEEASRATHIHVNVLKKIEADDFSSIGTVYAKGFLKIYAEFLGLDKSDIVERFTGAVPASQRTRAVQKVIIPGTTSPSAEKNLFSSALESVVSVIKKIDMKIIVIVVLCVVVFWGFRALWRVVARRDARKPAAQVRLSEKPRTVTEKKSVVEPKKKAAPAAPEKTVVSAPVPVVAEKVVLVVRARAKTWLQVKVDGRVVFQSVLARGAAESWTAAKKIEMVIGNAGAVELELNGRILERIGRPGQTLKHVVVTRDGLTVNK
ncbi:MAG: helix-turn-helix domain-containing protein [Candidatus Omnitrophica bacterium]|nr:helix-turn-helix domain-containing protein [Candidatus Omnitrophota bacterium]